MVEWPRPKPVRIPKENHVSSIKEKLNDLVVLQKFEDEINIIEKELAEVDGRINALNSQLNEYEEKVAQSHQVLAELKKEYRSNESEVQMIEAQIAKSQEKLGAVKTNKEYQSTLKEIDDLKTKASLIEDRMLETLDQNESVERQIQENEADLAEVKIQVKEKQAVIREQSEQRKEMLQRRQQERDSVLDRLTPDIKDRYRKVKRQGHGIAIAAVVDAVCQVCRMNIPPQLFNELMRMDSMHMCPNCQRIIYPKERLEGG
jgi:predicted  nucleic acid-binding Zn-ribbon protein